MSADNWTQCPRCAKNNAAIADQKDAAVRDAYGKVSVDAFDELRNDAMAFRATTENGEDTFREDYELGIVEGQFYVSYSGYCSVCKFSYTFKHEAEAVSQ